MNLLSLERWRYLLELHPMTFWGMQLTSSQVTTSRCFGPMPLHAWQDADVTSRSDIARAIEDAEDLIASYLGYYPAPKWKEVTLPFPRPAPVGLGYYGSSSDPDGGWMSVSLPDRYVQAVGIETMDYLGDATIIPVDLDGDGFTEAFSAAIELPPTVTDPNEVVCFPRIKFATISGSVYVEPPAYGQAQFDCTDVPLGDLCVDLSVGQNCSGCNVATITGPRWLLVRPNLYEALLWNPAGLSPTGDIYADAIAVYRKYVSASGTTKDTAQAVMLWETLPCPGWACVDTATNNSQDPAAVGYAIARCGIRNGDLGYVLPAQSVYDGTTGIWSAASCLSTGRLPDQVTIRYLSGKPWGKNRKMDNKLELAVLALSTARLPRALCANIGNKTGETRVHYYQRDMARSAGANDEAYAYISHDDLANPFGTRWGEIQAWKIVKREDIETGVTAG